MGPAEHKSLNPVIKLTCGSCRDNTIYIKIKNYKDNNAPFKSNDYICTECNHGMMQTVVAKK